MRISDLVRKCVAFIAAAKVDGSEMVCGTGFFVGRPLPGTSTEKHANLSTPLGTHYMPAMYMYFVTARHVLDGIRSLGLDELIVRINVPGQQPRRIRCALREFVCHPDPTADVAMVHTSASIEWDGVEAISWMISGGGGEPGDSLRLDPRVGPGSPVSIVGMFRHHVGQDRNIPIVRTGNIAAMPEEPVQTRLGPMVAALIEARSIGGLSGSPVFVHYAPPRPDAHPEAIGGIQLLGVMHGHFDDSGSGERLNVGVGIVTPASRIGELMKLPEVLQREAETLGRFRAGEEPTFRVG